MIAFYALTLAAFPVALGLAAWHGARDTWRPAKPGETPGQLTPRAEFAQVRTAEQTQDWLIAYQQHAPAAHASPETASTPASYRSRHAWVRAHNVAIGRPPAELTVAAA